MKKSLSALTIRNFTVFQDERLVFAPQLNVIVGENGTGKSHLLKLAYTLLAVSGEAGKTGSTSAKGAPENGRDGYGYAAVDDHQ